jgi:hypothetical protein
MNKSSLAKFAKSVGSSLTKHSPQILMGLGIAGMVTTTVLAVKATPRALELISDEIIETNGPLTPVEKVKVAWKPYIPAMITGVASVTCLISSNSVSTRRTAALAAAYQISETALTEYREQVVETLGEKKEKTIREEISKKRVDKATENYAPIVVTGRGKSLFLEPMTNQLFESDIDQIKSVVNDLNEGMINDMCGYVSLTEFYDEIGLDQTDISDHIGWSLTKGLIKVDYNPVMSKDGRPCLALYYVNPPTYGYDKIH